MPSLDAAYAMVLDSGTTEDSADQSSADVLPAKTLVQHEGAEKQQRTTTCIWQVTSGSVASMPSDSATYLAARRKRTEIRRLRLMLASAFEDVDDPLSARSERPKKKLKAFPPDITDSRHQSIVDMPAAMTFSDEVAMQGSFTPATGKRLHNGVKSTVTTDIRADTLQNVGEDKERHHVESRLAVPVDNGSCPSHCVVSICGCSREMEDCAIAMPSFISVPILTGGQRRAQTFHFYGVYDGHGGPQAAEYCKERLHETLATEMAAAGDGLFEQWDSCLESCFGKLDAELCGLCPHGSSECPRQIDANSTGNLKCREPLIPGSVGTTAVVAVVGVNHIIVGNCGDSRAVLSRGGHAIPLSNDHKANRPDEVARIEAAGGQVFTWQGHRVCGVLAMSRALGDGFLKPSVSGKPEVTVTDRSDDDECLILASDGLWDVLSNEFVCRVARKALSNWRKQQPACTADQRRWSSESQPSSRQTDQDSPAHVVAALLIKLALARNSKDNISVVVVDLKRS